MTLLTNRRAGFDYELLEHLEAGVELLGFEVKSLRAKHGKLEGAHVIARDGQIFLINAFIPPYQAGNTPASYDPYRNRKLLLTKGEIGRLAGVASGTGASGLTVGPGSVDVKGRGGRGLTGVPVSVYVKGRRIKVEIALARGKKKYDKRQKIKKRESDREIRRTLTRG